MFVGKALARRCNNSTTIWKSSSIVLRKQHSNNNATTSSTSSDTQYFAKRLQDLEQVEKKSNTSIYPPVSKILPAGKTISLQAYKDKYTNIMQAGEKITNEEHYVSGRILSKRAASNKLIFYTLVDGQMNTLQIMATQNAYANAEQFAQVNDLIKRGDIVAVRGYPAKSKMNELSIVPLEMTLLAPCLHQLPHYKHDTLEDAEKRYRNRHLDFLVNAEQTKHVFFTRAKIIKYIRNFFDERGYLEVETPVLSSLSGGANAKPFDTHLNALKMPLQLRVAPELFLKQLVIGGFDRVYEIGKVFRNEGVDATHNPEFTSIEAYQAYADYETMMQLTEELLSGMVKHLTGSYKVLAPLSNKDSVEVDFTPPFKRFSYVTFLKELFETDQVNSITNEQLQQVIKNHEIQVDPHNKGRGYMIDKITGHFLEPQCTNPTFICDHPIDLSPLAKEHHSKPGFTERFELFVCGKELCNAYSELNDPRDQRKRFMDQVKQREAGDHEAHPMDEHFCKALEYGLPPTGGWGLGIDRLVMMLTNRAHIRDALMFPLMKPQDE